MILLWIEFLIVKGLLWCVIYSARLSAKRSVNTQRSTGLRQPCATSPINCNSPSKKALFENSRKSLLRPPPPPPPPQFNHLRHFHLLPRHPSKLSNRKPTIISNTITQISTSTSSRWMVTTATSRCTVYPSQYLLTLCTLLYLHHLSTSLWAPVVYNYRRIRGTGTRIVMKWIYLWNQRLLLPIRNRH